MNTRNALKALAQMAVVIDSAESVVAELQALRDGTTDEQWEQLIEQNELLVNLVCACVELEANLED